MRGSWTLRDRDRTPVYLETFLLSFHFHLCLCFTIQHPCLRPLKGAYCPQGQVSTPQMASPVAQEPCLSRLTSAAAHRTALSVLLSSLSRTLVSLVRKNLVAVTQDLGSALTFAERLFSCLLFPAGSLGT